MSPTLRKQQLEAALQALQCAESNLDQAQEFADAIGDRPDVDSCMELAILLTQQAQSLTKWALTLLADGAAAIGDAMKALAVLLALALTGCATCRAHPTACNAVIIGVSAAAIAGFSAAEWHKGGCTENCKLPPWPVTP